jgi:hypothetical protein
VQVIEELPVRAVSQARQIDGRLLDLEFRQALLKTWIGLRMMIDLPSHIGFNGLSPGRADALDAIWSRPSVSVGAAIQTRQ